MTTALFLVLWLPLRPAAKIVPAEASVINRPIISTLAALLILRLVVLAFTVCCCTSGPSERVWVMRKPGFAGRKAQSPPAGEALRRWRR